MELLAWVPGPWELALIAVIALLLFGKRLPEIGRGLGKSITEFKKGMREGEEEAARPRDETPKSGGDTTPTTKP